MTHEQNTADLRKRIGAAHGALNDCKAQGEAITQGATARFDQVQKRIEQLRPKVITDPVAADEYLELTKEKGALLRTLSKS